MTAGNPADTMRRAALAVRRENAPPLTADAMLALGDLLEDAAGAVEYRYRHGLLIINETRAPLEVALAILGEPPEA